MKHKHAKNDYTRDMLPQTRRAIFFDILHLHWKRLLLLGLILLIFYIPLLISGMAKDIFITLLYSGWDGGIELGSQVMTLEVLQSAVNILFLVIFSVGIAGISRPLRQYGWEENVHTPTDFGKGVRDNWKHAAIMAFSGGVIYTLCLVLYYQSGSHSSIVTALISLLPIGVSLLIVAPVAAIALSMLPIYQNTFIAMVKNAFFVFIRSAWRTLGVLILCSLIWLPTLIPNFYCHFFGSIVAVLLTPFAMLAFNLFCYNQFDRHLNPLVSPQLIGKGIHCNEQI